MIEDDTARFPDHHLVVTAENIDAVRSTLPDDQQSLIEPGCLVWRMPPGVDEWAEPMGVTMTYWPQDRRGALHHDGSLDGSEWGVWHHDELWIDEGFAVDATGRVLRVIFGEIPPQNG